MGRAKNPPLWRDGYSQSANPLLQFIVANLTVRNHKMHEAIKRLIDQEASVAICADDLTPHANLYALGLTPYAAVRLLVAIERAFEVEFPRDRLNKQ